MSFVMSIRHWEDESYVPSRKRRVKLKVEEEERPCKKKSSEPPKEEKLVLEPIESKIEIDVDEETPPGSLGLIKRHLQAYLFAIISYIAFKMFWACSNILCWLSLNKFIYFLNIDFKRFHFKASKIFKYLRPWESFISKNTIQSQTATWTLNINVTFNRCKKLIFKNWYVLFSIFGW